MSDVQGQLVKIPANDRIPTNDGLSAIVRTLHVVHSKTKKQLRK